MGNRILLGNTADVPAGGLKEFRTELERVVVAHVGNAFSGIAARCPHMGGAMINGRLDGASITCALHGSRFNIQTGEVLDWVHAPGFLRALLTLGRPPKPIQTYAVIEEAGKLYLEE